MRFVLLLVALLGVVNAATVQILPNFEMNGCTPPSLNPPFGLGGPVQGWTVVALPSTDVTAFASSPQNGNFGIPVVPGIAAPDLCSGLVEPEGIYTFTPNSFTNVAGINTPQTFTLSAYVACRHDSNPAPCLFSILATINGSPVSIPFAQGGVVPAGAIFTPSLSFQLQTAEIIFNPATDIISIQVVVPTGGDGLITQVSMTFEAVMEGDPHLDFGFTTLDFIGAPHRVYNIISSPSLQINAFLANQQTGPHSFIPGPMMTKIAAFTADHVLIFNAGGHFEEEKGFMTLDGEKVEDGSSIDIDNLSVSFQLTGGIRSKELGFKSETDNIVAIGHIMIQGEWSFQVFFIENHFDPHHPDVPTSSAYFRRFLDAKAALLDDKIQASGVLGSGLNVNLNDKTRSLKDWKMEGTENEYEVKDGLLGTDFAFNKFAV